MTNLFNDAEIDLLYPDIIHTLVAGINVGYSYTKVATIIEAVCSKYHIYF